MYILDTDTCSYLLKQQSEKLINKLDTINGNDLFISVITQSELLYGARKINSKKIFELLDSFFIKINILNWDSNCAISYSKVRNQLEKDGTPIGNMDMMIASHAISQRKILITNNEKHFSKVINLKYENWMK